tara:strand:+ start:3634 stop:4185 length:552 start_codon:yes stop_codon:yes gene_type:complete
MYNLPEKWFFLKDLEKKSLNALKKIDSNVGVIFLNKDYSNSIPSFKEKSLFKFCKLNNINYLINGSIEIAIRLRANGVFRQINFLKKKKINKKLILATAVHNRIEIIESNSKNIDLVFLSPAFFTNTHKKARPLNPLRFVNLSKLIKCSVYALGGITEKNFKKLKCNKLRGFGGISYFKENIF